MSVCDLALSRWGGLTRAELEHTLQTFMAHRQKLLAIKKSPEIIKLEAVTPAAYFVFFAYYYTAQALQEMEPARREEWGKMLQQDLLAVCETDGTWIHLAGAAAASSNHSYATAMALLSLQHIEQALLK